MNNNTNKIAKKSKKKIKKKNQKRDNIIFGFVFIIGLLILLYPKISDYYYTVDNNKEIDKYIKKVEETPKEEIEEQLKQAHEFNERLYAGISETDFIDPFEQGKKQFLESLKSGNYPKFFKEKEIIGYIKIPAIQKKLAIRNGVTEEILSQGVGYLPNTSLPVGGNNTHTFLTAHRGLPEMELFRHIDKLKKGDKFYIYSLNQKLAYEVDDMKIILPNQIDEIKIVPGKDYATLLTCHPYTINSHRLLVRGHRVPYLEDDDKKAGDLDKSPINIKIILILLFLFIVILSIILKRKKDKIIARKPLKTDENIKK